MMLTILHQEEGFIAIEKPSGLLVHPSRIAAGERESCVSLLGEQLGRQVYPVHRLDRAASGVLLFALDSGTASILGQAFREKRVHKAYAAIVRGWVPESGTIDKPLRPLQKGKNSPCRPAVTRYAREAVVELPFPVGRYSTARYSLVRLTTETGRPHQIRRHLCSVFHPILGDTVYGDGRHNRFGREELGVRRLLLLGKEIGFPHPVTGETLRIIAPWPDAFLGLFLRFGWVMPDSSPERGFNG